jgi:hypothetical protein
MVKKQINIDHAPPTYHLNIDGKAIVFEDGKAVVDEEIAKKIEELAKRNGALKYTIKKAPRGRQPKSSTTKKLEKEIIK